MVVKNNQLYTTLRNGAEMPLLGLGVYDMHGAVATKAVTHALQTGYRLIDTASLYGNEREVGNAVRASGINREQIFVTTKVGNPDQGYERTLKAFYTSMQLLDIGYIDLYLVHWPIRGTRKETWRALEQLYREKKVRAIGVANYLLPFLRELETYAEEVPVVNQLEYSPWLFLRDELDYCRERGIQLQSYSPLTRGGKFDDPRLKDLCRRYGKTPAQMILRWNLDHGISAIPKSSNPARIDENFAVFDFSLSEEDLALMDSFHENFRVVDDPMAMF